MGFLFPAGGWQPTRSAGASDLGRRTPSVTGLLRVRPVGRSGRDGTPWAPVGTLFQVLSEPEIAFWKIDLAVDPAIVPPAMLQPHGRR